MKIIINNRNKKVPKELMDICNNNEILAKIFFNRGIRNKSDFLKIINPENYTPYNSSNFPSMDKACEIIKKTIELPFMSSNSFFA